MCKLIISLFWTYIQRVIGAGLDIFPSFTLMDNIGNSCFMFCKDYTNYTSVFILTLTSLIIFNNSYSNKYMLVEVLTYIF